jgi:Arginine-tRNA-protein transferase, C terminus
LSKDWRTRVRAGAAGLNELGPVAPADDLPEKASGRTIARGWSGRGRGPLGSFVILDHIEKAGRLGLPPIYLGYWVEGSKKMGYKAGYLPQERLGLHGWARVER